jgi:hypothetical protein
MVVRHCHAVFALSALLSVPHGPGFVDHTKVHFSFSKVPCISASWVKDIGEPMFRRWIAEKLYGVPLLFRTRILRDYQSICSSTGSYDANLWLQENIGYLSQSACLLSSSDSQIVEYSKNRAEAAAYWLRHSNPKMCQSIAHSAGIGLPDGRRMTESGELARLQCQYWWRRAIRKDHGRAVEGSAIRLGIVHKKAELYVSNESVSRRTQQRSRNRNMLESVQAVNELGQSYTLAELADLSVSNPVIRRGELMTRIAGFELVADEVGHVGEFYTFTCPSRMHPRHYKTGKRNIKYDGTTPDKAQKYLSTIWARARAAIKRRGLNFYGFRVAEPQHDGTPHWHLLLFMPSENRKVIREICKKYCLQVDGTEKGASEHRFKAVAIDKKRGTAAGYIAKYIAKNIDGYGVDKDLFGNDPKASARRVDAWASTWGVRQFQQIGGPSVTVWRELRRLGSGEQFSGVLADAVKCADDGDWAGYIVAMGGANVPRGLHPIKLAKKEAVDKETGDIRLNRYGEPSTGGIFGIECGSVVVTTRVHEWKVEKMAGDRGGFSFYSKEYKRLEIPGGKFEGIPQNMGREVPQSEWVKLLNYKRSTARQRAELFKKIGAADPWSPVNNCTVVDFKGKNGVKSDPVCVRSDPATQESKNPGIPDDPDNP